MKTPNWQSLSAAMLDAYGVREWHVLGEERDQDPRNIGGRWVHVRFIGHDLHYAEAWVWEGPVSR